MAEHLFDTNKALPDLDNGLLRDRLQLANAVRRALRNRRRVGVEDALVEI